MGMSPRNSYVFDVRGVAYLPTEKKGGRTNLRSYKYFISAAHMELASEYMKKIVKDRERNPLVLFEFDFNAKVHYKKNADIGTYSK